MSAYYVHVCIHTYMHACMHAYIIIHTIYNYTNSCIRSVAEEALHALRVSLLAAVARGDMLAIRRGIDKLIKQPNPTARDMSVLARARRQLVMLEMRSGEQLAETRPDTRQGIPCRHAWTLNYHSTTACFMTMFYDKALLLVGVNKCHKHNTIIPENRNRCLLEL